MAIVIKLFKYKKNYHLLLENINFLQNLDKITTAVKLQIVSF